MTTESKVFVELNDRQQELLLRGLRYVSSSVKLRREDPTNESLSLRREELSEIQNLADMIEGNSPAEMAMS